MQLLHHLAADLDRLRVAAEPVSTAAAVLTLTGLQDLLTRLARPSL